MPYRIYFDKEIYGHRFDSGEDNPRCFKCQITLTICEMSVNHQFQIPTCEQMVEMTKSNNHYESSVNDDD